jgi:glycosyltransferase involved in cell wall biosynthesis
LIDLLIVTPTLNAQKYLNHCLNSSYNLRMKGAKHIIVDSGSNDSTLEIAENFGVEVIYCPPGNMYNAINTGINKYNSLWVTYINADDYLFEDSIIKLFDTENIEENDIIYSNIDFINYNGHFLHNFRTIKEKYLKYFFMQSIMPIPQQGTIFKRKVFSELNGFSIKKKYSSDFDFFMKAFFSGYKFKKIQNNTLAAFRLHQDQISQNYYSVMENEVNDSINSLNQKTNFFQKIYFKTYLRFINLDSYLSRFLRFYFLFGKVKFNTTMKIDEK